MFNLGYELPLNETCIIVNRQHGVQMSPGCALKDPLAESGREILAHTMDAKRSFLPT